jgi:queuine tRNA-ribosyltransferase
VSSNALDDVAPLGSSQKLRFEIESRCGDARTGVVHLPRGSFKTPVFMPVGTRGVVRSLTAEDVAALGAEIILGNTYHLMLRPGADLVEEMGGLHSFSSWNGRMLTDSGGFQVFSLAPKVDDDGVTFASVYDGSKHRFTPEIAVRVQEQLGADIAMVLDVCPPLPSPTHVIRQAVERTAAWAARQRVVHTRTDQVQFGIVQGGVDELLRKESAERTVEIGFDGYAIGGLSVGESKSEMFPAIEATNAVLPKDRPRYLMGVGDPVSLVEGVARGVDMFDCVLPTRLARHGTVLTSQGRIQIRNAGFARDKKPLDPACPCSTCGTYSRGYLRHLQAVGELTAARLLTVHNLSYLLGLMDRVRAAIVAGTLESLRAETIAIWGS